MGEIGLVNPEVFSSASKPVYYVLDTNVLIYDSAAIHNFDEHNVIIGAIPDNLEALHWEDEDRAGSIEYVSAKIPLLFKSLNHIRGRSFQQSLILIDESQNLTPHQIKTIITRAGTGSKVICLGNLAQIHAPWLSPASSGLTYLTWRSKYFDHGENLQLKGVPRSKLPAFSE
jgi:PhoH-like ATPase